jgi:hypothetical protein
MVSEEDLELTVRSTLSENQVLSEEDFETKFQRRCEWPEEWEAIVLRSRTSRSFTLTEQQIPSIFQGLFRVVEELLSK